MLKYIFFLFFIVLPGTSAADQWLDPEFDEMIDSSIAIVLGEVQHGGTDYAEAKILKSFKGTISLPVIYIGGFSGRLGPYDTLSPGEKYYFFLRYKHDSVSDVERLNKFNSRFASLQYYAGKLTVENLYYVWTPTSGDILFDNEGVHADLVFNRSYKGFNDPLQKNEFEKMLELRINKTMDTKFREKIYNIFEEKFSDAEFPIVLQYLSMLHLIRSDKHTETIAKAAKDTFYLTRYLTAKYLSNLEQNISRSLLIAMLDDEDWLVQGEAVRQLKRHDPNIILPIFLEKIKRASKDEAVFSSGIMDPSPKVYEGAFIEMAEFFRDAGYKPAAPYILSALKEADWYSADNLADILDSLDKEYLVNFYLSKLNSNTEHHSFNRAVNYLTRNKVPSAKKLLIDYIFYMDKSKSDDTDIINKLAAFEDDEVKQFVVSQFLQMYYKSTTYSETEKKWINEFIWYFSGRGITEIKNEVYSFIPLNDVTISEDSLLYIYHMIKNEYVRIQDSLNKILSGEKLERGSVLVKLDSNFSFVYAAGYFLSEREYGIDPMYEEVSEDDIPDSTMEKFVQVKNLLGFTEELKPDEDILSLELGLYINPYLGELDEEKEAAGLDLFKPVLSYYIANPDKENFLKFFYLFNKLSSYPSDGYTLEELIKIGEQYY
jgi:hypothetical protein